MNLQEFEKQTRAIVIDIVERSAIKKVKFCSWLVLKRGFRWFDWENSSAEIGEVIVKMI